MDVNVVCEKQIHSTITHLATRAPILRIISSTYLGSTYIAQNSRADKKSLGLGKMGYIEAPNGQTAA